MAMRMADDLCALGGVPLARRLETVRTHSLVRARANGAHFWWRRPRSIMEVNTVDAPCSLASVPLARGCSTVCADVRVRAPRNGVHLSGASLELIRSLIPHIFASTTVGHREPFQMGQSPDSPHNTSCLPSGSLTLIS